MHPYKITEIQIIKMQKTIFFFFFNEEGKYENLKTQTYLITNEGEREKEKEDVYF